MNPQTVADWVVHAGWTGSDAVTAACVAFAGSGDTSPAGLFGLGSAGDGAAQALAAHDAWSARGFDIFPAYTNGRWRLFVPIMTAPVAAALLATTTPAQKAGQALDNASNTVSSTADAAAQAAHTLRFLSSADAWQRILKIAVGGGMVIGVALYLGKRETFDQGVRMLKFVGRNAGFINEARAAGAGRTAQPAPASSSPPPSSPPATPAPKKATGNTTPANRRPRANSGRAAVAASSHNPPGKHARPNIARASQQIQNNPAWSNAPTQPLPAVGRAKRPPNPMPGVQAGTKTRKARND